MSQHLENNSQTTERTSPESVLSTPRRSSYAMTASRTRRIAAALLGLIGAAGCGSAARGGAQASAQPPIPRPSPATIALAKADSVRHPYTNADVQFMSGMIGHH